MNASDLSPTRVRTAIALSIVAHLCALWLLAAFLGRPAPVGATLENGPIVVVTTIVRRERPAPRRALAAPLVAVTRSPAAPRGPAASPVAHRVPHTVPRRVTVTVRLARAWGPQTRRKTASSTGPRVVPALVPSQPAATSTPFSNAAAPSPVPSVAPPAPIPTSAEPATPAAVAANFGGLFSQNYPPAPAAPADFAAIRSRLNEHVAIRVDVDETGRATEVRFVHPPADEALAQTVRSELLALRYIPADCNGLHCDGTLEINY